MDKARGKPGLIFGILAAVAMAAISGTALFFAVRYPRKYTRQIEQNCAAFDVEPALVRAVIAVESSYRPQAVSVKGALGLMQLMPATAADVAKNLGEPHLCENLTDPDCNIRLGVAHLSSLLKKYSKVDALAAYNAGEGNLKQWKQQNREPFPETQQYIKKVLKAERFYKGRF